MRALVMSGGSVGVAGDRPRPADGNDGERRGGRAQVRGGDPGQDPGARPAHPAANRARTAQLRARHARSLGGRERRQAVQRQRRSSRGRRSRARPLGSRGGRRQGPRARARGDEPPSRSRGHLRPSRHAEGEPGASGGAGKDDGATQRPLHPRDSGRDGWGVRWRLQHRHQRRTGILRSLDALARRLVPLRRRLFRSGRRGHAGILLRHRAVGAHGLSRNGRQPARVQRRHPGAPVRRVVLGGRRPAVPDPPGGNERSRRRVPALGRQPGRHQRGGDPHGHRRARRGVGRRVVRRRREPRVWVPLRRPIPGGLAAVRHLLPHHRCLWPLRHLVPGRAVG